MRYVVPTALGALVLLGALALGGAGHGWDQGTLGCLFLAPLCFAACVNALRREPSRGFAMWMFGLGTLVCVLTGVATLVDADGPYYLARTLHVFGVAGTLVWGVASFSWALMCVVALMRARTDAAS